jgi:hypothetical protein
MGVPISIVRLTVQSRSCDFFTTSGNIALASSPCSPPGKAIRNVTSTSVCRLPSASRTLLASTRTSKLSGSARRDVRIDVDRGATAYRGQQQLRRREIGTTARANRDPAAPVLVTVNIYSRCARR